MAAAQNIEQARYKGMLESLQAQDPQISAIRLYSKFVVGYLLQQDGDNPGWRKANIEGPVYVVQRRSAPWYQLIVKNQFSTTDLQDNVHPSWELDCQKNYVFYKVEDTSKRIRGLWFHDDEERIKLEQGLDKLLEEIRKNPNGEPQNQQLAAARPPPPQGEMAPVGYVQQQQQQQQQPPQPKPMGMGAAPGSVQVTPSGLRSSLHSLVDDDNFISMVMQKLAEQQTGKRANGITG